MQDNRWKWLWDGNHHKFYIEAWRDSSQKSHYIDFSSSSGRVQCFFYNAWYSWIFDKRRWRSKIPKKQFRVQNSPYAKPRWSHHRELQVLSFRLGPKSLMDSPKFEDVSRGLLGEDDDEEDTGEQRHSVLLRFSWPLQAEEFVYVWLLKSKGRSPQGEDIPFPI